MAVADEQLDIEMDRGTEMRSLVAGPIAIHVDVLHVGASVEIRGSVDAETAARIFTTGTFHVDEADHPPDWDVAIPVDLVLRLRRPIAARYGDVDDLVVEMFSAVDSPLRHTEAWLLLEATQSTEVPGTGGATTSFGIRTDWADPIVG